MTDPALPQAIEHVADAIGTLTFVLFLFLLFKNMGSK